MRGGNSETATLYNWACVSHVWRMTVDPERLDALEHAIGRLTLELGDARRALAALRAESGLVPTAPVAPKVEAPHTAAPRPLPAPPSPARSNESLENLVGRYGVLALAVLTIVMGAGALVSWAITHGLLGPWVRVTLGGVLALALAATGWWLRGRDSRRFGNVLVALSLAVVDVVAWGAGPRLGLIPPSAALSIADVAAGALATLALIENEELLFGVGLGGALLAPFVMATGVAHYGLLAAYGLVVLAAAIRSIGERPWWKAIGLILVGTAVYAVSVRGYGGDRPWFSREFGALFAGAVTAIALVWAQKPARSWIALCAAAVMAFVAQHTTPEAASRLTTLLSMPDIQITALAGTALLFAAAHDIDERRDSAEWLISVILVPSVFLMAALEPLRPIAGPVAGSVALTWALAYAVSSLFERGVRRGVLITASGIAGLLAIPLLLDRAPGAVPIVLAAYAVLLAVVSKQEKQPVMFLAVGASLLTGFSIAASHVAFLTGYTTTPFLSVDSLGMASAVGAALLAATFGLPEKVTLSNEVFEPGRVGAAVASTLGFIWGHLELRRAFSADASTFALIAYYASCGVLAIYQGRERNERGLRQVGLTLAVLAALYAIGAASGVEQIGLRVGSYLLAGVFLLGVAWWYRGEPQSD
jgi:uncharacterized membrane protein